MTTTQPRLSCNDCIDANTAEVMIDYISIHRLSGIEDLTETDLAEIRETVTRILEEDRGIACSAHYDDTEW